MWASGIIQAAVTITIIDCVSSCINICINALLINFIVDAIIALLVGWHTHIKGSYIVINPLLVIATHSGIAMDSSPESTLTVREDTHNMKRTIFLFDEATAS